jgi:hypothetical protein
VSSSPAGSAELVFYPMEKPGQKTRKYASALTRHPAPLVAPMVSSKPEIKIKH